MINNFFEAEKVNKKYVQNFEFINLKFDKQLFLGKLDIFITCVCLKKYK